MYLPESEAPTSYGHEITFSRVYPFLISLPKQIKFNDIKFFYTVSRFHNPTGYSYSNAERRKIVELAQKYDVYIIEDDYLGDPDTDTRQDPMFAYDPRQEELFQAHTQRMRAI